MKKKKPVEKKLEEDIDIEEIEADEDEENTPIPEVEEITTDFSDVSYEDFTKANEITPEEEIEDTPVEEEQTTTKIKTTKTSITHKTSSSSTEEYYADENEGWITILSIFWTWFRRLGVLIAIILIAYFIVKGMFAELGLYILLLIAAYFFGYGFMAVLTRFTEIH